MVFTRSVPSKLSIYWRYLHAEKSLPIKEIIARYPAFSAATIYRHCQREVSTTAKSDGRKRNVGRPKLLTERDGRNIVRSIRQLREVSGRFSSRRVKMEAGITDVSDRTVRRHLNKRGYFYLQSRKKGLMSKADRVRRVKFAKNMLKKYPKDVWCNEIAFYLDGVSFVHKRNPADQAKAPSGRIWRQKSEGIMQGCTSKGSKVGAGGKVAHFMAAISYGKGFIICEQYDKMNGPYFASFIERNFSYMFQVSCNPSSNLFIQDGDPSQNSQLAKASMETCGAKLLPIPPRSPDLNPIENIFNIVRTQLADDAIKNNIENETFEQFSERARCIMLNFPIAVIDRTIDSMQKRMQMLTKNNGERLKY